MKNLFARLALVTALLALCALNSALSTSYAQGTAFTYQGQLQSNGSPANGSYDFEFSLYNAATNGTQIGGTVTNLAIGVTNGLFTTILNFGPEFTGNPTWLAISVRSNGVGGFAGLIPLQPLTPTPYAIYANTASNVSGTVSNASLPASPSFSGNVEATAFTGNGSNVSNVNAVALNGLTATNFWQTGGNNVAAGQFLGSTNNQAVELWANGLRSLRLEPGGASSLSGTNTPTGAPNVIGGSSVNFVTPGTVGAVIAGGGATNWYGVSTSNSINTYSDFSVIGGGQQNNIQTNSYNSVITGGQQNTIQPNSSYSFIAGGQQNDIQNISDHASIGGGNSNAIQTYSFGSTIGGGQYNTIQSNSYNSTIGGGVNNTIQTNSFQSTIGGGYNNTIQSNSQLSTIGGGYNNIIQTNSGDSTIGGGYNNTIQNNCVQSVISGGAANTIAPNSFYSMIGGGILNTILSNADGSTIAGGYYNIVQTNSEGSTIAGGGNNTIQNNSKVSTIVGGQQNTIQNNCLWSFIGGGAVNTIEFNSYDATIGGGYSNIIQTNCSSSTIAGGYNNQAANYDATVPGGANNLAGGQYSFAAGQQAQALHQGAFVWADSQNAPFASTAINQFNVRAGGGVRFVTGGVGLTVDGPFSGNGSGLTSLPAAQLSGTISLAQLPSTVVTNTETGVTLNNMTVSGTLTLPATTTIYAGGNTLLRADINANFFAGQSAGNLTGSGGGNTAIGDEAMPIGTTAYNNTAIGLQSLNANTTSVDNVAVGVNALYVLTTNGGNTAIGTYSLQSLSVGSGNIALGNQAGGNLTKGTNNIYIGALGNSTDNNKIYIGVQGTQTSTYIAGISGATAASGVEVFVNSSGQLGTATSSARFKRDIQSMDDASAVLLSLKPVTFKYKRDLDPEGIPQFGLVAEEVDKIDPDLVARDADGKINTVRYNAVNAMLLNEFLKEHRKVEEQNTEIQDLKQSLAELKQMVQSLAERK